MDLETVVTAVASVIATLLAIFGLYLNPKQAKELTAFEKKQDEEQERRLADFRAEEDRKRRTFEAELTERREKELEQFSAKLRSEAFEHETRYADLHKVRAEKIAELYRLMVIAERTIIIVDSIKPSEDKREMVKMWDESWEAIFKLKDFFDFNRIYFTEELCRTMDKLAEDMHFVRNRIFMNRAMKPPELEDFPLERGLEPARRQIEAEFRELLGVQKN